MMAALRKLRGDGQPYEFCADVIGVGEKAVMQKAREMGLNQRHNRGRRPGWATADKKEQMG